MPAYGMTTALKLLLHAAALDCTTEHLLVGFSHKLAYADKCQTVAKRWEGGGGGAIGGR